MQFLRKYFNLHDIELTWKNLASNSSGMLFMKGKDNVARPVRSITELRNNNFLTEVTRYLVKM